MLIVLTSRRRLRRMFFQLACLAMLMNAFAPSLAHALAARSPGVPVDVCSVHGGAPLAAAVALLNEHEERQRHNGGMTDCGHCLMHAGAHALLPPSHVLHLPAAGAALRPYLYYHAPRPLLALSAAPPRGPPVFA
jgi:hypothetical protein